MKGIGKLLFAALAGLAAFGAAAAEGTGWLDRIGQSAPQAQAEKPHVAVRLAAENDALVPGGTARLAVEFTHEEGWHTYWVMPGDAGLTTTFAFSAPEALQISAPEFPVPKPVLTGKLVTFGYEGRTLFPFTVTVPNPAPAGEAVISVHAEYLACREVCVPGEADAEIALPMNPAPQPSADAKDIEASLALIPEKTEVKGLEAVREGERLRLTLPAATAKVGRSLYFFPLEKGVIALSAPQRYVAEKDGSASLYLTLDPAFAKAPAEKISGVLAADGGPAEGGFAVETSAKLTAGTVPAALYRPGGEERAAQSVSVTSLTAAALAFLGGLLLNLMPCVFPVLSLKILQIVGRGRTGEPLLPHGLAFTLGVLLSMAVLSGVLIALKGIGMSLGWGFQLQSPAVVVLLLLLFAAITFNLLGFYEFTAGSAVAAGKGRGRGDLAGSFFTGVLAVVVASPCTAPFMGAALGFALTQPAAEALFVFLALGFGMALPWLVLTLIPGLARHLPKPGPWMVTFRRVMAVPMGLAALWLAWVLSKQVSPAGMAAALLAVCALGAALWLFGRRQWGKGSSRGAVAAAGAAALILTGYVASGAADRPAAPAADGIWQPWSEEAVELAVSRGRPAFVDFTAAWCVTCQANKLAVLDREDVQAAFKKADAALFIGDWTNRDPKITAMLAKFGRSGVPLYLLYRTDGSVEVLPELLTPSAVEKALSGK
ncbi:MAG: Thioredoxin domain-containing protein [Burkholderia sp.]|jgi:thiol:disulfide interchange protein